MAGSQPSELKRAVQSDVGLIQKTRGGDPHQVRQQHQAGHFGNTPQTHDQQHDRGPQKIQLGHGPIRAVLVEVQPTPKNVQTSISLPEFPIIKNIDKEKFKIAILNLVVNAIEAMDNERGLLSITLNQTLDYTAITIADNGSGMTDEQLKKLFEPYFTTKKNGMGLGLVSTLNIIKSHQAAIDVESIENEGTSFRVVFPGGAL